MKYYIQLFLLATNVLPWSSSFTPVARSVRTSPYQLLVLAPILSKNDEYDDWYADFDPSLYEPYNSMGKDSSDNDNGSGRDNDFYAPRRGRTQTRGGSSGGSFGYTRDTSRDNSNVDEDAVNRLLNERVDAKKRRDFDTADAIRDQLLRDYAVGVFDKDRTWRTGCSSSGSGMRQSRGAPRERGEERGRAPERRPRQDFGPNGHDYRRSSDAGPNTSDFSEDEIHNLIAQRLQAKLSRNFNKADELQAQLLSNGVYVHDARKEWRADGIPFGDELRRDGRPGRTAGSRSDRNQPYQKSMYSSDLDNPDDEGLVQALLEERSKLKLLREYEKADAILEGLQSRFNVVVDDRLREWSVGGDFGSEYNSQREMAQAMRSRGFAKSPSSLPLDPDDEEIVVAKIQERVQAKQDRDFDTADLIRTELEEQFGVYINDKQRLWSAGGDFGDGPKRPMYKRRGGGNLTNEEENTISEMLTKRFQAKKDRHFRTADEIREHLRTTYNVAIDDKNREWHLDTDEYISAGIHDFTPDQVAVITELLQERFACKAAKEYDRADDIRSQLREEFNVEVDDRTKEWRCVPMDDATYEQRLFRKEAVSSQSSAFQRTQIDRDLKDELDSVFADDGDDDNEDIVTEDDQLGARSYSAPEENTEDSLSTLTVVELKEKLRNAGLPVTGKKSELIERLLNANFHP